MNRFGRIYGANPLHLLAMVSCFALVGSVIFVAGPTTFINTAVWWQSIIVWFIGGAVLHDLVLFPLYAVADWSLRTGLRAARGLPIANATTVPIVNYVRLPVLGTGLTFLLFFPGIIEQGAFFYVNATGLTQEPFLGRWLLLVAAMFGASAIAYVIRAAWRARSGPPSGHGPLVTTRTSGSADGSEVQLGRTGSDLRPASTQGAPPVARGPRAET